MTVKTAEGSIIRALSERIVEAQRPIRILDQVKWDDTIKRDFFRNKAHKLPKVDQNYYKKRPLPFDVVTKMEEFRGILRDTNIIFKGEKMCSFLSNNVYLF